MAQQTEINRCVFYDLSTHYGQADSVKPASLFELSTTQFRYIIEFLVPYYLCEKVTIKMCIWTFVATLNQHLHMLQFWIACLNVETLFIRNHWLSFTLDGISTDMATTV